MNDEEPNKNWVDPDIVAMREAEGSDGSFDFENERTFREFFETGWLDPKFDDLRPIWDPLLNDEEPRARVLAKTALWSVVQLRRMQEKVARIQEEK